MLKVDSVDVGADSKFGRALEDWAKIPYRNIFKLWAQKSIILSLFLSWAEISVLGPSIATESSRDNVIIIPDKFVDYAAPGTHPAADLITSGGRRRRLLDLKTRRSDVVIVEQMTRGADQWTFSKISKNHQITKWTVSHENYTGWALYVYLQQRGVVCDGKSTSQASHSP